MKAIRSLLFALLLTGCTNPLNDAKRAVNSAHDIAPSLAEVIDVACTREYQRASDAKRVAELDKVCLPLRASYLSLRAAHLSGVAAVLSAEAGTLDVVKATQAGLAVLRAIEAARVAAEGVK